jgi:hypothetical protein
MKTVDLSRNAIEERQGWRYRVWLWLVEHAGEGDNHMLALVYRAAVLRNNPADRVPRVGNNCIVARGLGGGKVLLFKHMSRAGTIGDVLWPMDKWVETWRRVGDAVHLTHEERVEMTGALRGWIAKDHTAESGL